MILYILMVLLPIAAFGAGMVVGLFGAYSYLRRKRIIPSGVSFRDWVWETVRD